MDKSLDVNYDYNGKKSNGLLILGMIIALMNVSSCIVQKISQKEDYDNLQKTIANTRAAALQSLNKDNSWNKMDIDYKMSIVAGFENPSNLQEKWQDKVIFRGQEYHILIGRSFGDLLKPLSDSSPVQIRLCPLMNDQPNNCYRFTGLS